MSEQWARIPVGAMDASIELYEETLELLKKSMKEKRYVDAIQLFAAIRDNAARVVARTEVGDGPIPSELKES